MARFVFRLGSSQVLGAIGLLAVAGCGGVATGEAPGGLGGSLTWTGSPPDAGLGSGGSGGSSDGGGGGAPSTGGGAGSSAAGDGGTASGGAGSGGHAGTGHGQAGTAHSGGADAGGPPVNLIENPSFEEGHDGWVPFGPGSTLAEVEDNPHSGTKNLVTQSRGQTWNGPLLDITSLLEPSTTYEVSAWVRIPSGTAPALLTLRSRCQYDAAHTYSVVASGSASEEWTHVRGQFTAPACTLDTLGVYVEGPPPGVDLHVDDVGLFVVPDP